MCDMSPAAHAESCCVSLHMTKLTYETRLIHIRNVSMIMEAECWCVSLSMLITCCLAGHTQREHVSCVVDTSHVWHAATHCNTLQHTATHCNTLRHTATHCTTLQHTDATLVIQVMSGMLQHTATHCNTLQHTATHCNTLQHTALILVTRVMSGTLHHTASHCITLHHTATHCNTLQHTAPCTWASALSLASCCRCFC